MTYEEQVERTRRWCERRLAVLAILGHRVTVGSAAVDLTRLQTTMARTYGERDAARGVPATVAWLASLANQLGLSLDAAVARYADACPKCGQSPCGCVN